LRRIVQLLATEQGAREIALSCDAANEVARRLYASEGFVETGERTDDGEVVARLAVGRS
jgi:RimJ/RimL family protein N-acetyltransferase